MQSTIKHADYRLARQASKWNPMVRENRVAPGNGIRKRYRLRPPFRLKRSRVIRCNVFRENPGLLQTETIQHSARRFSQITDEYLRLVAIALPLNLSGEKARRMCRDPVSGAT